MCLVKISKWIKLSFLYFIISSLVSSEIIGKHYLGANFDFHKSKGSFIDKFECKADPHWIFSLSSKMEITSITINGINRKYSINLENPKQIQYKVFRKIWEPKNALINIEYFSKNLNLFNEIIPNQLIQLNPSQKFYTFGNELTSQFEFHLQIPSGWELISNSDES